VPHIKSASTPIALGGGDVAPTATTNDTTSSETPKSTVGVPADATATPTDIVQDIGGLASEKLEAPATTTITATDDDSLPEETQLRTPPRLLHLVVVVGFQLGREAICAWVSSFWFPVTFRPSSS